MHEDFSERLFAHFIGGQWRVPFATAAQAIACHDGTAMGQIVPANASDIARACALGAAADGKAVARLAAAVLAARDDLAQLIALQSGQRPAQAELHMPKADQTGPRTILFGASDDLQVLLAALCAHLRSGLIWCPPPSHALLATGLTMVAQRADLPHGSFSLLHAQVPQTEALLRATGLATHQI